MSNKTKQGALNIMGMAASQARLLSITSRLSDNEFNAQGIMRTKMQNSKETDKLSEEYRRSLDLTKMVGQAYKDNGLQSLDLSYDLIAGDPKMPLQTQYAITNANGQLIVPKRTGDNYTLAIEGLDLTKEADFGKAFDRFIKLMDNEIKVGPVPIPIEEWEVKNRPAYMDEPIYKKYMDASEAWGEASKELMAAKDNFRDVTSKLHPVKVDFTAEEADECRMEILLSDPNRRAKIIAFAKLGTGDGTLKNGGTTTITLGATEATETTPADPGRSYLYTIPPMNKEFNVYKWNSALDDEENLAMYLNAVMASIANGTNNAGAYADPSAGNGTSSGEWGNTGSDAAINNFFNPAAIDNLPIFNAKGIDVSGDYRAVAGKDGYKYTKEEAALYDEANKRLMTATENEKKTREDLEGPNGDGGVQKEWRDYSKSPELASAINEYNNARSEHLEKYAAYCKNKYAIYSDPKQAEYYSNLFAQIATRGAVPVPEDQLNNNQWFQQALKTGQIFLEKYRADGTWESCHWKTEPGMSEVIDNEKAGKIKTKYELDLDKLQRKEDTLDMQLKNIETEHSALQTEFDGVKSVIQKNVERSFKTLG